MTRIRHCLVLAVAVCCFAYKADAMEIDLKLTYLNTGDYGTMFDTAIKYLESEVRRAPTNTNTRFVLGTLYFDRERYAEAKEQFEQILKTNPNDADSLYYAGVLAGYDGKTEKFTEYLERTIHLNPMHVHAYNRLGARYDAAGEFEKAKQLWSLAQSRMPQEESFYVNQAILHWSHLKGNKDRLEVVIANLNEALKLRPREQSFVLLGYAYFMTEQYEKAKLALQKALDLNPKNADALVLLATTYVQTDEVDKAIAYAERAQKLKPDDTELAAEIQDLKEARGKRKKSDKK